MFIFAPLFRIERQVLMLRRFKTIQNIVATRVCLLMFLLLTLLPFNLQAEASYRSAEVKRLVTQLNLNVDSLKDGLNCFDVGNRVVCLQSVNGQITTIGYQLFTNEMKEMAKTPILNFLERYFLLLDYPAPDRPSERKMREDRFRFETGSISVVPTLKVHDNFTYNYENNRYIATWLRENEPVLSVSFPAEHELISGENKIEAEDHVEADILCTKVTGSVPVNKESLTKTVQKDYFIKPGSTYLRNLLSSDLYYMEKKGKLTLVSDISHPLESTANMLLSTDNDYSCTLKVKQVLYGYKKKFFDVPLKQWIAYCQKNGCELYYGVESIDETVVKATVIAVNTAENYNHVLFVNVPLTAIETGSGDIEAHLETFIPMHNVMNLFAKYRKVTNKQQKIYE